MEKVALITGSSGFIGYHLSKKLLEQDFTVIGLDNMSDYYDVTLKEDRQSQLENYERFIPIKENVEKIGLLRTLLYWFWVMISPPAVRPDCWRGGHNEEP